MSLARTCLKLTFTDLPGLSPQDDSHGYLLHVTPTPKRQTVVVFGYSIAIAVQNFDEVRKGKTQVIPQIAFVEDDEEQASVLGTWLSTAGYGYERFATATAFLDGYRDGVFNLISLDWDLPDGNGLGLLQHLREQLGSNAPVMFLSAHDEPADCITALDAGADDFIVKSAHNGVLLARMRALLRRATDHSEVRQIGRYRVDRVRRQVMVDSLPAALTEKEFALADLLLSNPDKLLSRELLLDAVWGGEAHSGTRTVDTHASRVRQKLGLTRRSEFWLRPVYGKGYKLLRLDDSIRASNMPANNPNRCDSTEMERAGTRPQTSPP